MVDFTRGRPVPEYYRVFQSTYWYRVSFIKFHDILAKVDLTLSWV